MLIQLMLTVQSTVMFIRCADSREHSCVRCIVTYIPVIECEEITLISRSQISTFIQLEAFKKRRICTTVHFCTPVLYSE